jgi:diguanylate cyclase (GGDEF)-like protein
MIQIFDAMYRCSTPMVLPIFNLDQLSTNMFAMGFDQEFITACEYQYGWGFKHIFTSLYDGTLRGKASGQDYLKGFATFLGGAFTEHSQLRTSLNDAFERSLLNDGYRFNGRDLVEVGVDTSVAPELSELNDRDALLEDVSALLEDDESVAVMFIDLDHFKHVNDQLSHADGDKCLVTIVRTISAVLLHKGRLYRVGGDEFCAMLPNFSRGEAAATAERVRKAVDDLRAFGGKVKVTVSVGVAVSSDKGLAQAGALVKAADEVMYVAAEVVLRFDGTQVGLRVHDYGVGISKGKLEEFDGNGAHLGLGLTGMKNRVQDQQGQFRIVSTGSGTTVQVELPTV